MVYSRYAQTQLDSVLVSKGFAFSLDKLPNIILNYIKFLGKKPYLWLFCFTLV